MDIVITYVNGLDPAWQKDYTEYTDKPVLEKRFRDWGTLKYLLRGIQYKMPFIENVFLVVSHESQVPAWVDKTNLKIALHKDFIPAEYLPTFNSTTIEMFLHRIEGLSEQYLYFNDDIFPVKTIDPSYFYINGKARIGISNHILVTGMYKRHVKRSDSIARKYLGKSSSLAFIRPQHTCMPMFKSECAKIAELAKDEVKASLTRVRSDENMNMTLFISYMYHQGRVVPRRISCSHLSLAAATVRRIADCIERPSTNFVCINDVQLSEKKFADYRSAIHDSFEKVFPEKSRFEL